MIQNNVPTLEVRNILNRRFRNALDVVPAWAATYGVRAARERFESRNQLHRFFDVAGYRPS